MEQDTGNSCAQPETHNEQPLQNTGQASISLSSQPTDNPEDVLSIAHR